MSEVKFAAKICLACTQTTEYLLALDRGTAEIVVAIARAIDNKGINAVHLTKEMEVPHEEWTFERAKTEGVLTSTQIGNASRAHRHGLIAAIKGERGNWCLTSKGSRFLRHERVPKYAIVDKISGHQNGYFHPDELTVTIDEALGKNQRWEGINFTIEAGRILKDPPVKNPGPPPQQENLL